MLNVPPVQQVVERSALHGCLGAGSRVSSNGSWSLADLGREAAAGCQKVSESRSLDTRARLVQPISFQESLCFRDFGGISAALPLPHLFGFKRRVFQ